ncbi:MAG: DUF4281 domain-containing protein [Flavobacteriales bacterium]|nr:DUF4281 domain-containing protein [Flavobacteriales bacterium]
MDWELVFKIANISVLPGWFLLILFPNQRATKYVAHSYLYPILLGLLYLILMINSLGGEGGMDTLDNLKVSFGRDEVLVLGWVHYLVFDLFIGAWIVRDSSALKIGHIRIVPSLILTLFAGPIGLLSFLILRWFYAKKLTL